MGHIKFQSTCLEQGGLEISLELAKKAVNAYREKYYKVKAYWYDLERAAIEAVKTPGTLVEFRNLQWLKKGRWLYCQLPSGRRLAYYNPIIKTEETAWGMKEGLTYMASHPKTKKWERERTYGGKMAENVTQAVAADVLRESMLRVESKGYSIILTVHDENITEDDVDFGDLKEFETLMSVVPKWATGLPIKVESYEDERYKK
jgi:DNA polymerase